MPEKEPSPDPATDSAADTDRYRLDTEVALMAMQAQDLGDPTALLNLDKLTDTEKRALLALLRRQLGTNLRHAEETGEP